MLQVKKRPLTYISDHEWHRRMALRITFLKRAAWVAGAVLVLHLLSGWH